jgi:hypothetical protein
MHNNTNMNVNKTDCEDKEWITVTSVRIKFGLYNPAVDSEGE